MADDSWDAFPTAAPTTSQSMPTPGYVPSADGRPARVIMDMSHSDTQSDGQAGNSWDAFPTSQPTDYGGIAKQAGIGLAKGVTGLAGLPGDLQTLAQKGVDYVKSKLPDIHLPEPSEEAKRNYERYGGMGDTGPEFQMPTSADIQGAIEKFTGAWRKPQNQTEADAETVGEFLPAALAGPGSIVRKAVTQAAIPAAASITAGRLSDQNPYVKTLAAVLAGGAGAMASSPSSAENILRSKIPASVTENDITRAGQLIDHANTRGVTLTWPEALTRVTGQPVLTDTQRILESHGQTRAAMNDVLADRPAQVDQAARNEFGQSFGPASQNPSMLGPQAQQAAEGTLNQIRGAINRATRPSYDAAGQTLVPVPVHAAMIADPLFEDALNTVRNDPARNAMVRGHSDRSVAVYDAVKKELQERAERASNPVQPNHSQAVSSATGQMADTVRNVAIAADRQAAGGPHAVSNYEQALADQARLRQQYLEPLQRGPLGKLAETPDTKRAINALFPSNPLPASEQEVRDAVGALVRQRPAVAEQLVRAHAEMVFNEAARELQGGANAFAGAKFAKLIAGNSQQRANLQAAVESLPNGQARWEGFQHLLDIMAATGARQPRGSLTAFNELEIQSMSNSGLSALAAKGASPGKWMTFASDAFKSWSLGRNLNRIAAILTDPGSGNALRQIVRIPAGSDRALVAAGKIIANAGAATTEQRLKLNQ
jgi:hypothetical protein